MDIIETLEGAGRVALTAIEHGAAWLVGRVASTEQSLSSLSASSPLVAEAIVEGEAAAVAHGVPVAAIVNAGEAVLAAATGLASSLGQTATPVAATDTSASDAGAVPQPAPNA